MDSLLAQWTQSPNWAKMATFLALPTAGFFTARVIDDYRGWLNLGPGGLPYNIKGYLANLLVTAIFAKNETKSLDMYERPEKFAHGWGKATPEEKANAQKSFFKDFLPERDSPVSKSIHHCAPQREKNADEYIDPQLKETYLGAFKKLVEKNGDALKSGVSIIEGHGDALFLKETYALPSLIAKAKREVAHIHDSDMSAHMLLSFADATDVISKGWGERHRMTGSSVIPLGYTMLYVPRNIEEVDVFIKIFEAGIEYAKSNGRES